MFVNRYSRTCGDKGEKASSACFSITKCCLLGLQNEQEQSGGFGSMVVTALSFLLGDFCPIQYLSPTFKGLVVKGVLY